MMKKLLVQQKLVMNIWSYSAETSMYPEGGGQHCDIGSLSSKDSHLEGTDVQKVNNTIIHQCKLMSGKLNVGDT